MGIMTALGATVIGIVGAVGIGLLKDEAAAWTPVLVRKALARAVRRLPEHCRERYAEEWAAHVDEYPGRLSQLFQAIRFISAAKRIKATAPMTLKDLKQIERQLLTNLVIFLVICAVSWRYPPSPEEMPTYVKYIFAALLWFGCLSFMIMNVFWYTWLRKRALKVIWERDNGRLQ